MLGTKKQRSFLGGDTKHILLTILRISLGALFIYASYYKLVSPGAFAHQIYNYKILPSWAINPIALSLPWLQLFCGVALIINRWTQAASLIILGMLVVFQAAVASALVRGLNISCGCFKSGGSPATWWTFARDSLLLLLAGLQCWSAFRKSEPPRFEVIDGGNEVTSDE